MRFCFEAKFILLLGKAVQGFHLESPFRDSVAAGYGTSLFSAKKTVHHGLLWAKKQLFWLSALKDFFLGATRNPGLSAWA